jgi:hypothetical protein
MALRVRTFGEGAGGEVVVVRCKTALHRALLPLSTARTALPGHGALERESGVRFASARSPHSPRSRRILRVGPCPIMPAKPALSAPGVLKSVLLSCKGFSQCPVSLFDSVLSCTVLSGLSVPSRATMPAARSAIGTDREKATSQAQASTVVCKSRQPVSSASCEESGAVAGRLIPPEPFACGTRSA